MKCRNPSVKKCLNCDREYCNIADGVPMDESEIIALFNVGMASNCTLSLFRRRQNGKMKAKRCGGEKCR